MEYKAMLPDSTQSETAPPNSSATRDGPSGSYTKGKKSDTSKKSKKRRFEDRTTKSSKKKKLGKEKAHREQKSSKKSKKSNPASKKPEPEEQDSDLDLENELKPVRDYIKDRDDMLQHMFKCVIKANKLQAMLPDILKDVKVDALQELCLLQLEGMSNSRVMSILAGEEMQTSSDDDDSDFDLERAHSKPDKDTGDSLINSEVVDSTSSLPQASQSVGDAEEAVSMQEVIDEVTEEEANVADSDAEHDAECEADEDVASIGGSWHDDSERQQSYYDKDADDEADEYRCRDKGSDADSLADDDRDESQNEEVETVVKRVKKFRRIKIVRAEGEECEEGEITSDEVETDEESMPSHKEDSEEWCKPEDDTLDVELPGMHPEAANGEGEGPQETSESSRDSGGSHRVSRGSVTNSGNQGNDDNDDAFVDADDASAHVVIDVNVDKDVADATGNVVSDVINDKDVANDSPNASVAADVSATKDILDNSLNIFAEDNLEMDSEEPSTFEVTENVVNDSDIKEGVVEDVDGKDNDDNNVTVNKDVDNDGKSGTESNNGNAEIVDDDDDDDGADESDNSEHDSIIDIGENTMSVQETPDPHTQGQGASVTNKPSGRKVAQQLEVLELELRARAIRSLMKQYGKDVG